MKISLGTSGTASIASRAFWLNKSKRQRRRKGKQIPAVALESLRSPSRTRHPGLVSSEVSTSMILRRSPVHPSSRLIPLTFEVECPKLPQLLHLRSQASKNPVISFVHPLGTRADIPTHPSSHLTRHLHIALLTPGCTRHRSSWIVTLPARMPLTLLQRLRGASSSARHISTPQPLIAHGPSATLQSLRTIPPS